MKKLGVVVFVFALIAGVVLANLSAFGRLGSNFFNVSVNFASASGSGRIITETRDVRDFTSIDVGGVFRVEATAQKDFNIEVQADDNLVPLITTEVRGGVLHIEADKHLKSDQPIIVRVFAPDFENIETSGASNVSVKDLKSDKVSLDASGASKLWIQGSVSELGIDISGASNIDAGELAAQKATIDASGASTVSVTVSNELNADASGASKIVYSGTARNVNKKTSGASSVVQK